MINTKPAEETEIPVPCCPHCGAALPVISYFNWQAGDWVILCVYCPAQSCRKTIHLQLLPNIPIAGGGKIIDA